MKNFNLYTTAALIAAMLSIFATSAIKAQQSALHFSLNLSKDISGSGHNSNFVPSAQLKYADHKVSLGFYLDYKHTRIKGANVRYHYILNKSHRKDMLLYAHISGIYRQHASLTNRLTKLVYEQEYKNARNTFTTVEAYAGFGIKLPLIAGFAIDGTIGAGSYQRTIEQSTDYRASNFIRFTPDQAASLYLSIGVCYCFN